MALRELRRLERVLAAGDASVNAVNREASLRRQIDSDFAAGSFGEIDARAMSGANGDLLGDRLRFAVDVDFNREVVFEVFAGVRPGVRKSVVRQSNPSPDHSRAAWHSRERERYFGLRIHFSDIPRRRCMGFHMTHIPCRIRIPRRPAVSTVPTAEKTAWTVGERLQLHKTIAFAVSAAADSAARKTATLAVAIASALRRRIAVASARRSHSIRILF